jgi:hypothetical protein
MRNNVKSTTSRNLEYASWAGMGISLILMTYSVIVSSSATSSMMTDWDNYLVMKDHSREVFMHSSLMMVFSMMGLFVSSTK